MGELATNDGRRKAGVDGLSELDDNVNGYGTVVNDGERNGSALGLSDDANGVVVGNGLETERKAEKQEDLPSTKGEEGVRKHVKDGTGRPRTDELGKWW